MLLCTEFYFKAPSALTSRDESVSVLILICGITVWSFFSHSLLTYEMFLFTKTLKKRQLRSEVESLDQVRNAVICFSEKLKADTWRDFVHVPPLSFTFSIFGLSWLYWHDSFRTSSGHTLHHLSFPHLILVYEGRSSTTKHFNTSKQTCKQGWTGHV